MPGKALDLTCEVQINGITMYVQPGPFTRLAVEVESGRINVTHGQKGWVATIVAADGGGIIVGSPKRTAGEVVDSLIRQGWLS